MDGAPWRGGGRVRRRTSGSVLQRQPAAGSQGGRGAFGKLHAVTQKLLGIAGFKNAGKTTLTERLVEELTARGYRVSTVKHAHHGFDVDQEGRDSWRHRQAGASEVAIVSSKRWALVHELRGEEEPRLTEIIAKMASCDLI